MVRGKQHNSCSTTSITTTAAATTAATKKANQLEVHQGAQEEKKRKRISSFSDVFAKSRFAKSKGEWPRQLTRVTETHRKNFKEAGSSLFDTLWVLFD